MPLLPTSYLLGSVGVGIAQVADAVALVRNKNRIAAMAIAFSFAEYIWAGVSFFVWQQAEEPFPHWLPAVFIAYVLSFMAAGLFIAVTHRNSERAVPNHLAVAGGVFGAFFALASTFALVQA